MQVSVEGCVGGLKSVSAPKSCEVAFIFCIVTLFCSFSMTVATSVSIAVHFDFQRPERFRFTSVALSS